MLLYGHNPYFGRGPFCTQLQHTTQYDGSRAGANTYIIPGTETAQLLSSRELASGITYPLLVCNVSCVLKCCTEGIACKYSAILHREQLGKKGNTFADMLAIGLG